MFSFDGTHQVFITFIKSLLVPLLSKAYSSFLSISVRKQLKVHINTVGNISVSMQYLLSLFNFPCLPWKVRAFFCSKYVTLK